MKKVNSSDEAYSYGGPDSSIAIVAQGVNIVLASTGGQDRARRTMRTPGALLAGSKAADDISRAPDAFATRVR